MNCSNKRWNWPRLLGAVLMMGSQQDKYFTLTMLGELILQALRAYGVRKDISEKLHQNYFTLFIQAHNHEEKLKKDLSSKPN